MFGRLLYAFKTQKCLMGSTHLQFMWWTFMYNELLVKEINFCNSPKKSYWFSIKLSSLANTNGRMYTASSIAQFVRLTICGLSWSPSDLMLFSTIVFSMTNDRWICYIHDCRADANTCILSECFSHITEALKWSDNSGIHVLLCWLCALTL